MLSIRSCHGQIPKAFIFNSSSSFLRLIHSSTTSPSADLQPHFMVDYLIHSLGFSKQQAISPSTKVRHLKSTKNSQSVIHFLRNYNLSETDIKSLVLSQPSILLRNVDKTLEPKFKILFEIGVSGPDLVAVIKKDPNLLCRGLHTSIIPAISFLRKIFGTNKDIQRVIIRNPRLLTQSPERLEENLVDVEREFGIMRSSPMFSYGLWVICSQSKLNLQKKFEMFKSFGWSVSDICTIAKSQPVCFTLSEERLGKGLNFFMEELGYTPSTLARLGCLLMYSLEKRVKPRYQVFKVLKEKGVISFKLHSVLVLTDVDFVKRVVHRNKEAIPDHLYDCFTRKLKC